MLVKRYIIPVIGITSIAASIAITQWTRSWVSTGRQVIQDQIVEGKLNPDDVKGWMTFNDVSEMYGVPLDKLLRDLHMEDVDQETPLREFESDTFSPQTVRDYLKGGATSESVKHSPEVTPNQDTDNGAATTAPASVASSTANPELNSTTEAAVSVTKNHDSQLADSSSGQEIKGFNTLSQVAETFGLTVEEIRREAGLPEDADVDMALRDFRDVVPGFEVSSVRDAVDRLLAGKS